MRRTPQRSSPRARTGAPRPTPPRHNGGSGALLFRSMDEGEHWVQVKGLPRVDRNINTWQVATFPDGRALAVVRDTDLYASEDWGVSWELAPPEPAPRHDTLPPTV